MENHKMKNLIKISILAKELGISRQTVKNWYKQNKINLVILPGGHYFITQSTYDSFLNLYKNKKEDYE